MSWKDKALALHKRFGAPAKFAAKMVLGAVLPGSPAVVELVCGVLDCVHETTKDHLEFDAAKMRAASAADLQRVEQVLDVLNGDLAALMAQLAHLEQVPDIARQMLDTALATDERCRKAAHRLDELARRFDRLEEQNRRLLSGQGYAAGMLEELLPLMRRVVGVVDFVEELCAAGLQLADFRNRLHAFQDGANALGLGRVVEAEPLLLELAQAQPRSGATATVLAAAQAAAQDLPAAEKTLARAVRLRPADAELADLHRRVTVVSRGATPSNSPLGTVSGRRRVKVGDVLDGWRVEQMLGSGGWGQVFKANRGDKVRALKVMHPDLSADALFVERFKGEILTLARLCGQHPHLVEIDGFGYAADAACWYFSMEFIDGVSLEQYLQRRGALTLPQARRLFFAVAEGLAAAHARGIVHRDIKPANILLRPPDGKPVLIDFGLAALADGSGLTKTGRSAGYTAMFAAPEQLRGRTADVRSDVYSLAASLYYALVYDQPAFREPHLFEPEQVPEALRQVLIEALHQNPDRRTQTVATFANALRATVVKPVTIPNIEEIDPLIPAARRIFPPTPINSRPTIVKISLPGRLLTRPANDPNAEWMQGGKTPATITIDCERLYQLCVAHGVTDEQLGALAQLREVTNLQSLDLGRCEQVRDADLAHLRGLTNLHTLRLSSCYQVTDAGVAHLRGLTKLHKLVLYECKQVTDAGLAHLRGLTELQSLNLERCRQVTDAGLAHLRALTQLQSLDLSSCDQVTDAGFAHLRGLTNLQSLIFHMFSHQVTAAGLAHLRGMTNLQSLDLWGGKRVSDAGLAHLRGLTNLQSLKLGGCKQVTDAGLAHLRGLTNLHTLKLVGCDQITDDGLANLRGLTKLKWLDLGGCKRTTDAGIAVLRSALLNCKISR